MDLPKWVTGATIDAASLNKINTALVDIEGVITSHASFIQDLSDTKFNTSDISSALHTYLNDNTTDINLNNGEFGQLEQKMLPSIGSTVTSLNTLLDQIKDLRNELRTSRYKIGDIRITTTSTNPTDDEDNIISGALRYYYWLPYSEGRFLLGAGGDYTSAEAEGGEAAHTLTISEMPTHNHSMGNVWHNSTGSSKAYKKTSTQNSSLKSISTDNTGGGQPHNNMPPYKVVYFWKCVSETDYNNAQNSPSE